MAVELTVQAVKNADPRATRYILWDTSTKGFGLRVNVDGSKTYLLKYAFEGGTAVAHDRQTWVALDC